jgi:carboxylesterase type B
MEWVRDNIAQFGGDTSRITLFGQSAGAASADFYAYRWTKDPIASGIILQSGTAFSFGLPYSKNDSATKWYGVATAVGCGDASTDPTALLACMRTVNVTSLLGAVPTTGLSALLSAFGPTVDDTLVFSNYSLQTPASVPVLIGSNDYEPGFFRTESALTNTTYPDVVWDTLNLASWTCPAGLRANASVAANNPTWRYRYFGNWPNTNVSSEGGAYHGAELPLVFGSLSALANSTTGESKFEAYIQGAWATFAKDPVHGLRRYKDEWPEYNPAKKSLIRLAFNNLVGTNIASPIDYDRLCINTSLIALETSLFS